jgi:general secretion pathway protein K
LGRPGGETAPHAAPLRGARQRGAALLLAMLTVTLVATLAANALWQQWRALEIERAERQRAQAAWILAGALDWARLILREDARGNQTNGNPDHLGEPWALPLEEARLSSFLAADRSNNADSTLEAFLSGEMSDLQSRLNFNNLVRERSGGSPSGGHPGQPNPGPGGRTVEISEPDLLMMRRLYELLGLPQAELNTAAQALLESTRLALNDPLPSRTPLLPAKLSQLSWLGLSTQSLARLEPHLTVLPQRSTLNLNTASAEAIAASMPGLDLAQARKLVAARERTPFRSLADAARLLPEGPLKPNDQSHGVRSAHFEVRGRLRLDDTIIEERSLVVRNNLDVRIVWRERFTRR